MKRTELYYSQIHLSFLYLDLDCFSDRMPLSGVGGDRLEVRWRRDGSTGAGSEKKPEKNEIKNETKTLSQGMVLYYPPPPGPLLEMIFGYLCCILN